MGIIQNFIGFGIDFFAYTYLQIFDISFDLISKVLNII